MTSAPAPKVVAVFQRCESGELRGHAFSDEGSAAYEYGFACKWMRGEVRVRPGIGPAPTQVWLARVLRAESDGAAPSEREDPTAGAGPYFLWAQWEVYTGAYYSMYEPQGCTSMHESLAAAEARWKEIASQRMERLFHLVLAAPIETATAAAP